MIREIKPTASNGHRFILVAIDYFTMWVEAASFASVTKNVVARFIKHNLICRYDTPERIITDNGSNLNNKMITELCTQFKIKHQNEWRSGSRQQEYQEVYTEDDSDLQRLA